MNDWWDYLEHSAKGVEWAKHKYIRKEGNKYIYPEDLKKSTDDKKSVVQKNLSGAAKAAEANKKYWQNKKEQEEKASSAKTSNTPKIGAPTPSKKRDTTQHTNKGQVREDTAAAKEAKALGRTYNYSTGTSKAKVKGVENVSFKSDSGKTNPSNINVNKLVSDGVVTKTAGLMNGEDRYKVTYYVNGKAKTETVSERKLREIAASGAEIIPNNKKTSEVDANFRAGLDKVNEQAEREKQAREEEKRKATEALNAKNAKNKAAKDKAANKFEEVKSELKPSALDSAVYKAQIFVNNLFGKREDSTEFFKGRIDKTYNVDWSKYAGKDWANPLTYGPMAYPQRLEQAAHNLFTQSEEWRNATDKQRARELQNMFPGLSSDDAKKIIKVESQKFSKL